MFIKLDFGYISAIAMSASNLNLLDCISLLIIVLSNPHISFPLKISTILSDTIHMSEHLYHNPLFSCVTKFLVLYIFL